MHILKYRSCLHEIDIFQFMGGRKLMMNGPCIKIVHALETPASKKLLRVTDLLMSS